MPLNPPDEVLDLFAVPGDVHRVPGDQGGRVQAGDLLLTPGRDATIHTWLSPLLARLAVRLDEDPGRARRDLRVVMPVPARDGSWVVDGWSATRFEAGTTVCEDLAVTLAAGQLFHAQLDVVVPHRPPEHEDRHDRWGRAERVVFGPSVPLLSATAGTTGAAIARRIEPHLTDAPMGREQLVHTRLSGNVLLDASGAPLVSDVAPAWRPSSWAEALCVLDVVVARRASLDVLARWTRGREQQAMLRAIGYRAMTEPPIDSEAYEQVLDVVAPQSRPQAGPQSGPT